MPRPCSLRRWGDTRVAYDGESALATLQDSPPDVILLDIGMRRLDGYATAERIRRVLGNQVLLVALTGFGQDHDKERAMRVGFDVHLTKPADATALAGLVDPSERARRLRGTRYQ